MARINLLPWREELKKEREQKFYVTLGIAAVVSILVVVWIHLIVGAQIDHQIARNQFLTQQINRVEGEIETINTLELEKQRLLNRMTVIQRLQTSRPEIVHLFEELVRTIPDGARLVKTEQVGAEIVVEGVAESNAMISSLMRNIDRSPWLENPELIVIDSKKREFPNASWFKLKFYRKAANADKKAGPAS
jgi:type IV pilus assembly protein PilN